MSNGKAAGVGFIDAGQRTLRQVRGKLVILCASSLSVRLLLNWGICNSSGVLGHYLLDNMFGAAPMDLFRPGKPRHGAARRLGLTAFTSPVFGMCAKKKQTVSSVAMDIKAAVQNRSISQRPDWAPSTKPPFETLLGSAAQFVHGMPARKENRAEINIPERMPGVFRFRK